MKITPTQLAKRVEKWQQILAPLGIGHFSINCISLVDEVPGTPGSLAAVTTSQDYDYVRFYFNNEYLDEADAEDVDRTIVHEWLHVALRDLDHALRAVEKWMPEATYDDWDDRVTHEREGLIERLASLIVALHGEL